jgi:hypothetical protein
MTQVRNSFADPFKEPVTKEQLDHLIRKLDGFWEDTVLVTKPNGYEVITVGNLKALAILHRANLGQLSL